MPREERVLAVWYRPFMLGGVETFLLHMARAARARGNAFCIAAITHATGPLRDEFERAGATLLDWTSFAGAFAGSDPSHDVCRRIGGDLSRIRPTLTLLNDCNDFSIGAAPLLERLRAHATIVDTFHIDSPDPRYLDFRRSFVRALDGVAGTNRAILERFARHDAAFARVPGRYVPNGVPPCPRDRAAPGDVLRLLYLGRLAQEQKRVMLLPELFARLRARGRAFEATICGDGPERELLEAGLHSRGLSDCVRCVGYQPPVEVEALLLSHDVLVNVSTFEGFSMSVLEALAAGCVPACTDVQSIDHDRLVDGVNCLLAPVDRPENLVDLWAQLTAARLAQMSGQARASAASLTADACYAGYLSFAAQLREARPLEPWPADAYAALDMQWDISRDNPWRPARPPWHRAVGALKRKVWG